MFHRTPKKWLAIDRTFVLPPPLPYRVFVEKLSPEIIEFTFTIQARGILFFLVFTFGVILFFPLSFLALVIGQRFPQLPSILVYFGIVGGGIYGLAWLVSRPAWSRKGGRIRIDESSLHIQGICIFRWSKNFPRTATTRFDIELQGDESPRWTLLLLGSHPPVSVVGEPHLTRRELEWLKHRLNEWLGWRFPSHCAACGRPLEARDLDWPSRSVLCSECGFAGPAPDPLSGTLLPTPPPTDCPTCHQPIWLPDVNRETATAACRLCGWASQVHSPPDPGQFDSFLEYFTSIYSYFVNLLFCFPGSAFSDSELIAEFPSAEFAWKLLEYESIAGQFQPTNGLPQRTVTYHHWQTHRYLIVVTTLAALLLLSLYSRFGLLDIPRDQRGWAQYFAQFIAFASSLTSFLMLTFALWWGARRTQLIFTPDALIWTVGDQTRMAAWRNLCRVALLRRGWPPFLLLMHGGAAVTLAPPSCSAARAITRICLEHCSRCSSPLSPPLQETLNRLD